MSLVSLTEILDDGVTGFLVPPNDPESLADHLLRLMRDPALAAQMGAHLGGHPNPATSEHLKTGRHG